MINNVIITNYVLQYNTKQDKLDHKNKKMSELM